MPERKENEIVQNAQWKPQKKKSGKERKTKIESKNKGNKQKTVANTVDVNPTISTITLNVNVLSTPIKRQGLSQWIKKQDPTICLL